MPAERLSMRKIKEVLRLHAGGHSGRKIAPIVGVGATTVREYLARAKLAALSWPLPAELDDEMLERRLFPPTVAPSAKPRHEPDWAAVHQEMRRRGVTLQLLWQEYRAVHPDGFGYSWFCDSYRDWSGRLSPTMRQSHPAGERLFVDYAGQTAEVIDGTTGEVLTAQVFIGVMGASSYTFATASWTQGLQDWVMAHVAAFTFFGGVPRQVIPDYVPGHIIVLLCPPALCGAPPSNRLLAAALRHISFTRLQANRGASGRFAKLVFGEAPPKKLKGAGMRSALLLSF